MITIVGATGYIGRKLQRAFQKSDQEVRAISRSNCNYLADAEVDSAIQGSRFVINAAGYTGRRNVCLPMPGLYSGAAMRACNRKYPTIIISTTTVISAPLTILLLTRFAHMFWFRFGDR